MLLMRGKFFDLGNNFFDSFLRKYLKTKIRQGIDAIQNKSGDK